MMTNTDPGSPNNQRVELRSTIMEENQGNEEGEESKPVTPITSKEAAEPSKTSFDAPPTQDGGRANVKRKAVKKTL